MGAGILRKSDNMKHYVLPLRIALGLFLSFEVRRKKTYARKKINHCPNETENVGNYLVLLSTETITAISNRTDFIDKYPVFESLMTFAYAQGPPLAK